MKIESIGVNDLPYLWDWCRRDPNLNGVDGMTGADFLNHVAVQIGSGTEYVKLEDESAGTRAFAGIRIDAVSQMRGLVVHPSIRRKGVGALMVDTLCELAFGRGSRKVVAFIPKFNEPSLALFRRNGFECEGLLQGELIAMDGSPIDVIIMAKHRPQVAAERGE